MLSLKLFRLSHSYATVRLIATGLVMLFCPAFSFADELPKESVLPLAMASKAAQAAVEACKKDVHSFPTRRSSDRKSVV